MRLVLKSNDFQIWGYCSSEEQYYNWISTLQWLVEYWGFQSQQKVEFLPDTVLLLFVKYVHNKAWAWWSCCHVKILLNKGCLICKHVYLFILKSNEKVYIFRSAFFEMSSNFRLHIALALRTPHSLRWQESWLAMFRWLECSYKIRPPTGSWCEVHFYLWLKTEKTFHTARCYICSNCRVFNNEGEKV